MVLRTAWVGWKKKSGIQTTLYASMLHIKSYELQGDTRDMDGLREFTQAY